MCNYTYHHYSSCGHISNWSMTSCQEYTNKLRLAGPERSVSCTHIEDSHDLLSTQPSMCVECESEWAENISNGDIQTQPSNSYQAIEGIDTIGHIIQVNAVSNPTSGDRDTSSTDHSDNGQIFLGAAVDDSGNADADNSGHSDNGQFCPRGIAVELKADCKCEVHCDACSVKIEVPDTEGAGCESPSDNSSCDTDSSGSSLCGSSLIRYNILKLRIDEYVEQREQQRLREAETDQEQHDADVDHHVALTDAVDSEVDHRSYDQPFDIDIVQQRIEATVLKRIEETNEKEARQKAISKLLDTALLQKDQDDRREQNAELGIEEDPHLWDTESVVGMWHAKSNPSETPISPHTCISPNHQHTSPTDSQPQKHMYMGSMFADEETANRLLLEARPYGDYPGEWEGFMMAFSAEDANRQGLLDPIHVRGCCSERRADFHLYYGLMHASSEAEAEKRWLEDIRRIPGEEGKFYGLLRADDMHHARAMGLTDIRHPWGCCKDGLFTMPERVLHKYTGFMCAGSLEEVGRMGLCDAVPVPGECGDYYGGTYYGYVEAFCEFDAFNMGLKEPEHGDCCAKTEVVSISEGQYTYYGYMYGRSEEEVVNRGLKDVLLVPGFDIKYSGNLRADSEEEAKAMGLFEPSRIE
ncbi:uncharacterized protein PGRI_010670 [Penicillium griseofulvum]|uniref:Uncharacterized protein n=1 Tax=Penicillium patulum TaxID=5078 RepID=A0A135LE03_PENPA|nr:uncharacterized protein PGRI_010670 [Penicillium griseofulvum]KXG47197.1 hypothetical protein PGRI_010670 [Penicillium griseofulvum]